MGQALKFNTVSYAYGNSNWGDLLTSYGGTAISYDAIGNPTNWRNTYSMSWDARRLTNQRMNNSDWLTYTYNADGIRTQKYFFNDIEMYGTTHDYVLDGTNIIRETVTGGGTTYTLHYLYDESGSVQGFIYNNNYYYYQKNLQGDVIRILNYSGNVVVEYTYDAWGKVLTTTGTLASTIGAYNPFRYRGYFYDNEIGLYYVSSRYYDPEIGRFINAYVPEILTVLLLAEHVIVSNLFAYCKNNPVMNFDLLGCASIDAEANWLVNALFGSIMALKLSGAALATKVSAMILAIAPYLFWIVVAVAVVVIIYFIAKSAVVSKADSKIRRTVKKNSKTRYWTATVRSNYVDIGRALTYSQAVKEVIAGRSVFTVTWYEAKAVALAAGGSTGKNNKSLYPEIDKGKENTKGYYWHYHTYNRKGGHVYYLF